MLSVLRKAKIVTIDILLVFSNFILPERNLPHPLVSELRTPVTCTASPISY